MRTFLERGRIMFRKIVSIVLIFILMFTSMPVQALDNENIEKEENFRLLVKSDDESILEDEHVLGYRNDTYLLQFSNKEEKESFIRKYEEKSIIEEDETISFDENTEEILFNNELNPFQKAEDIESMQNEILVLGSSGLSVIDAEDKEKEEKDVDYIKVLDNQRTTRSALYVALLSSKAKAIVIPFALPDSKILSLALEGKKVILPYSKEEVEDYTYAKKDASLEDMIDMAKEMIKEEKENDPPESKTEDTTEAPKPTTPKKKNAPAKGPLKAAGADYTITFDAKEGFFTDPGVVENVVSYKWGPLDTVKYSHTPNINDAGQQNGNYAHNLKLNNVIKLNGAQKLRVKITWGGESSSYDWACAWKGAQPGYTAYDNYGSSFTGKLGGGSHTSTSNTKQWTIEGDTVTIGYRSDGSGLGDGYGYYAVITALDNDGNPMEPVDGNIAQSGTYISPRLPGKTLEGWYYDEACTNKVNDIIYEHFTEDTRLYAKYKDDDWYTKYNYTLDEETHTIKVTKYNGSDPHVVLPSKAIINGVEYSTVVSGAVYQGKSNITDITFDEGIKAEGSLANCFNGCTSLNSLKLRDFDTSNCTNMQGMFQNCSKMTKIDVTNFNTENVTNMNAMFSGCTALNTLDVSQFDTGNVTNMGAMFQNCSSLTQLNVSNFNTEKVKDMSYMFSGCSKLNGIDVSNWNTSNVEKMDYLFSACSSLTSLNVSNWDTGKANTMNSMFSGCSKLPSLNVSNWNTSKVNNMANMFSGCSKLGNLNMSNWNTSQVTDMNKMFYNCSVMTNIDVSSFDTSKVTNMNSMFSNCRKATSINTSSFDTSHVTNMSSMFNYCDSMKSFDLANFDTGSVTNMSSMFSNCTKATLINVSNFDTKNVTNMQEMFYNCAALKTLDVSNWNTSKVTSLYRTFYNCSSLPELDVSNWNTGQVTTLYQTFCGCSKLETIDVSNWNTAKVTTLSGTFMNCSNLKDLPVQNWNTGQVTTLYQTFSGCNQLTQIPVQNWNVSKVTTMAYAFQGCSKVQTLPLQNWNTGNVTNLSYTFSGCSALTDPGVSNWNTAKVTTLEGTFNNCKSLTSLDISRWNTGKVSNMSTTFQSCTNLQDLPIENWNTTNLTTLSSTFYGSGLPELDLSRWNTAKVTNMYCTFSHMSNLTDLNVNNWNTAKVTDMRSMFSDNTKLKTLDLSSFSTPQLSYLSSMFSGDVGLEELTLSPNFNTSRVSDFSNLFYNCSSLKELDVSMFNTANATNTTSMFYNCKSLESLDVTNFNTAKVVNANSMFYACDSLKELDLSSFDLSKCTSNSTMISGKDLAKIVLGPKFKFNSTNTFPTPNWFKGESMEEKYSPTELKNLYNASMADTYYREYTVNFNGNGGQANPKTKYTLYGKEIESLPTATKLGYHLDGWFTEIAGGEEIHVGDSYLQDTYYAHWSPNHYTLRLNPNGGQGANKDVHLAYNDTYFLSPIEFERPGWEIASWNTKRDGSGVSYAVDDEVTMMTPDDDGFVTLYAQWSNEWYDITFDSQGGNEVPSRHIIKGKKVGSLYEPARQGYQFMGWYTEPNGQGTKITKDTLVTEDKTYYAAWSRDPVITFNNDGQISTKIVPYGMSINTLPVPTKTNYTFDGWYTEPNGGGTKISSSSVATENMTVYANWILKPVFDPDGGIITRKEDTSDYEGKDPEHFTINSFPVASKPGYQFDGWYTTSGRKIELGDEVDLTESSKIIAHWTPNPKVKITFNGNGVSNPASINLYENQPIGALPYPNRSGYRFLGWKDENGDYVDEHSAFSEDTTLTAQWERLITLTFDANGGSAVSDRKAVYNQPINIIPGTKRSGYILEGWYNVLTGEKLTEDTIITKSESYRAKWIPETYTGSDDSVTYVYSATWSNASNANVDNIDNNLEFHPSDTSTQTAQLHIRFELNKSVDRTLPIGAVNIRIPKTVWKNWEGEKTGSNNLSVNLPEWPNKRNGMYFSYIEEEDSYVLINNVELPGGAGVDLTVNYTVNPMEVRGGARDYSGDYVDGYDYYQNTFSIPFTIDKDMDGTTDINESLDLSLEMHTRILTNQSKGCSNVTYTWNNSWGAKPEDADDYFYVVWNLSESSTSNTNQPFTYHWSEDTVHDGTVVKMPSAGSSGMVVTKHPKTLLEDLGPNGLKLYNEAVVHEDWKSGYETTHRVSASTVIRGNNPHTGEFDKHATASSLIQGGQEDVVDDQKEITLPYQLTYNGNSYNLDTMPYPDGDSYTKNPRTIVFTDGIRGDLMYNSGSPSDKYNWVPETGNVILGDSDYYIKNISFNLSEYDVRPLGDGWTNPVVATDKTQYDDIEIWIRKANQVGFEKFSTIKGNNTSSIPLPDGTVGFQIKHPTSYYQTSLQVNANFVLKPTPKIMSLVQSDMAMKTTSIIKNNAVCTIEDSHGDVYFQAAARTGDHNSAHRQLYELNTSTSYMYVTKSSANQSAVILDVDRGTQDNPMLITGRNYNTSGRTKSLTNGVFYDLLPKGTEVDLSTLYGLYTVYNSSGTNSSPWTVNNYNSYKHGSNVINPNYYRVEFIENWEGSKQTMMKITVNLPKSYKSNCIGFLYLLHNTYENIVMSGTTLENDVAFANIGEGHVIPEGTSNARTILQNEEYFQELERQYAKDIGFAQASTHYNPIDAFSWGFFKTVKTDTEYQPEGEVARNSDYTYRLTYSQSAYAMSDNLVFYDVLEGGTDTKPSQWYGILTGVDVEAASRIKGYVKNNKNQWELGTVYCHPVVYYSTKPRGDFTAPDFDVTKSEIWSTTPPASLADVTAVAVDCSKTTDNKDFVMVGKYSMNVFLNFKAPKDAENIGLTTTNEGVSYARKYDNAIPNDELTAEYAESTVTIKDIEPELHKTATPVSGTLEAPTLVDKGDEVKYKISVKNKDSESSQKDILVEDVIPENMIVTNSDIKVYVTDENHALTAMDSPRVDFTRDGRNLKFLIHELLPSETMYFTIVAISDGNHVVYANQAHITDTNEIAREIDSEITYHETNFYPIHFAKQIINSQTMLPGAELTLYDNQNHVIERWITSNEDKVINLIPGTYRLSETQVPSDYMKSPDISFTISHEGEITPSSILTQSDRIVMYDIPRKDLTITKDSTGNYTDPNDTFDFQIHLGNLENKNYSIVGSDGVLVNGNAITENITPVLSGTKYVKDLTVTLKAGQNFKICGLPVGMTYQVKEMANSYRASYSIDAGTDSLTQKNNDANALSGLDLSTQEETLDLVDDHTTIHFSNERKIKEGDFTMTAKKLLDGETLQNEQFTFELYAPNGQKIDEKKNDANGNISFNPLHFTTSDIAKNYVYVIREKEGTRTDMQYAPPVYAKLEVLDTPTDTLDFHVSYYSEMPTATSQSSNEAIFHNYKKETVSIKKVDPENHELNGAVLQILNSKDEVVDTWQTANHESQLITGTYRLHEDRAPIGFAKANDIPIEVQSNGTVLVNGNPTHEVVMIDPYKKGKAALHKTDELGNDLSGVVYRLEKADGTVIGTKTTDSHGNISFDDLNAGEYVLIETKTKDGKTLLKDPISFTLPMVVKKADAEGLDVSKADEDEENYYFYELKFEVKNNTPFTIPMTGDNKTLIWLYLISFSILLSGLWFFRKKETQ